MTKSRAVQLVVLALRDDAARVCHAQHVAVGVVLRGGLGAGHGPAVLGVGHRRTVREDHPVVAVVGDVGAVAVGIDAVDLVAGLVIAGDGDDVRRRGRLRGVERAVAVVVEDRADRAVAGVVLRLALVAVGVGGRAPRWRRHRRRSRSWERRSRSRRRRFLHLQCCTARKLRLHEKKRARPKLDAAPHRLLGLTIVQSRLRRCSG